MNNYFFFIDVRKYFVSMALLRKFRISKLYQHSKNVAAELFKLMSIKNENIPMYTEYEIP